MASEKMTSITLGRDSAFNGVAEWGECSIKHMVEVARKHSKWLRAQADAIDAAADSDFHVETYRGVHVQRNLKVLQEGRQ